MSRKSLISFFIIAILVTICSISVCFLLPNLNNQSILYTRVSDFLTQESDRLGNSNIISTTESSKTFDNEDGTYTTYLFQSPVYLSDGSNIDNSLVNIENSELKKDKYSFKNKRGLVDSFFSKQLDNACLLQYSNKEMKVSFKNMHYAYEDLVDLTSFFSKDISALCYRDLKQKIYIYPTKYGMNFYQEIEEISNYNLLSEISVKECYIDDMCPDYLLFRQSDTNDIISIVYAPIAVNQKGEIITGEVKGKKTNEDTYVIQSCFKSDMIFIDSETEYEVINSFCLYIAKQPDSTVYQQTPDTNSFLSRFVFWGTESEENISQTYIRFEDLENFDLTDVISAKYYIHSFSSEKMDVIACPVVDDWCSFAVNWEQKPRYDKNRGVKGKLLKSCDYEFDITQIIKEWNDEKNKDNPLYSIRKGIVLVGETKNRVMFSSNDNEFFNPVLVLITKNV